MNRLQQKPILFLFSILFLSSLACQAVANMQTASSTTAQEEAAAEAVDTNAVDTVSTQTSTTSETAVTTSTGASLELQDTLISVYQRVNPAVVNIFVYDAQGVALGSGSGFLIDNEGHIVTNNHVVQSSDAIEVVFTTGDRYRATINGLDIDSDLAVIQVDGIPAGVQPVPLGNSADLHVGEFVITIGNPFGEEGSMSLGIISGLERTINSQRILPNGGIFSIPQVIQTDAAINPGNSGGPLLNLNGEAVGVNSAITTLTGTNSGVGFSIPIDAVKNIAPELIANGRYVYPFMGISMLSRPFTLTQLEQAGLPPNGIYITGVSADSPAGEAGLVGSEEIVGGDYIIAIDGEPVSSSDELLSYLVFKTQVGQTVDLTVIRDGAEVEIPLTLGERP